MVSGVVLTLVALLYPLEYVYPVIPLLPSRLSEAADVRMFCVHVCAFISHAQTVCARARAHTHTHTHLNSSRPTTTHVTLPLT